MLSTKNSAVRQFEEISASGDSIVQNIKAGNLIDDSLKTRLSQAMAIYRQALMIEIDNAQMKNVIQKKIGKISSLQRLCKGLQQANKDVDDAVSLGYGFENVVRKREAHRDSIQLLIKKQIDDL